MKVSKVQEQSKLNKAAVAVPKASAAKSATLPKASAAKTGAVPYVSAVRTASVPQVCAHSQIRERAFAIFEEGGGMHGHDLQNWLHAEREVMHPRTLTA